MLKTLCDLNGTSGNEAAVRAYILEQIQPYCTTCTVDAMGSVIAFKKGKRTPEKRVMLSAHMYEVGFIITGATEEGYLQFAPVGGINPSVVLGRRLALENGGFGTGHNTVLSLLHSRVHFILNPDIQLTADTLSDLADWMAAHPDAVMARPGLRFPDGRSQSLPLRRCALRPMVYRQLPFLKFLEKYNRAYLMEGEDLSAPVEIEFCTGSFSAVRTAEFKAVGGFDEHYFMYVEDADLTQKMRTKGKAYLVPQYTAIHAWHRAAHRSLKPFLWQLRSLLRYFSKWGFAW